MLQLTIWNVHHWGGRREGGGRRGEVTRKGQKNVLKFESKSNGDSAKIRVLTT